MTQRKTLELPDLPSDGIQACLEDLDLILQDNRYQFSPYAWHHAYLKEGPCRICLGGARLARVISDPERIIFPAFLPGHIKCLNKKYDRKLYHKVRSMDSFLDGHFQAGIKEYMCYRRDISGMFSPEFLSFEDEFIRTFNTMDIFDTEDFLTWRAMMDEAVLVIKEEGY